MLLENGANVNHNYQLEKEDKWNCLGIKQWHRTPLMHAAQHSDKAMLEILISNGANPQDKDSLGSTAFDYAKANEMEENAGFLSTKISSASFK